MSRCAGRQAKDDKAALVIGYLRCYSGQEFHLALEEFSTKHPDVSVKIEYGNHVELYELLRAGGVDLVLNDQRRAFSDRYVNLIYQSVVGFRGDSQITRNHCAFWMQDNSGYYVEDLTVETSSNLGYDCANKCVFIPNSEVRSEYVNAVAVSDWGELPRALKYSADTLNASGQGYPRIYDKVLCDSSLAGYI